MAGTTDSRTANDLIYKTTAHSQEYRLGGPGTCLPRAVESLLAWSLAIGCLAVSGYHYLMATFFTPSMTNIRFWLDPTHDKLTLKCWIPLMTCSRSELDRATTTQRYQQLVLLLQQMTNNQSSSSWSDEQLVQMLRSSDIARRLASLAMRPTNTTTKTTTTTIESHDAPLRQQLIKLWPVLLTLPPPPSLPSNFRYDISLIVPAYRELGSNVYAKLSRALQSCRHPNRVQVIVINAGGCENLIEAVHGMQGWGDLQIVPFTMGGGRGPCLNFGAQQASGRLYSFCHSDTTMPNAWDVKIIHALDTIIMHDNDRTTTYANSCAFSFGIDTSEAGLQGGSCPPGIQAVETTANLRTHMYSLPYGDQVLSIPAVIFDYIGGFPDQCLMEDYELISLLRRRAVLRSSKWSSSVQQDRERLVIIGGAPALCSPRRWQKFGVLYVTFMNSKFVNLYAGGLPPDEMFQLYYGRPPPTRSSDKSPWEIELERMLTK